MGGPRQVGAESLSVRLAPILLVATIIGGGVFEIVGFTFLFKILTFIIVAFLVTAPPIGALLYIFLRVTKRL